LGKPHSLKAFERKDANNNHFDKPRLSPLNKKQRMKVQLYQPCHEKSTDIEELVPVLLNVSIESNHPM
jgi:hypothetical protein